jgi:hypothetical protein
MKKIIVIAIASAIVGALLAVVYLKKGNAAEGGGATPPPEQPRVVIENGEPTMTLDEATQKKVGVVTTRLTAANTTEELEAFGNVVDVKELADFANQYAASRAQQQQALAKASFDERQLQRLRTLNADNKNVSDRAVQEVAATVAADNGQAAAANAAMQGTTAAVVQRFGPTIANALANRTALYENLVGMREVLVELAMPSGVAAPQAVRINVGLPPSAASGAAGASAAGGGGATSSVVAATLLSTAPRVDPKLQGRTFFYITSGARLSAGMNVAALIPTSRGVSRVVVPPDAVVSWEGRSWVYVRRAPTKFARIDATAVKAGDEVVTTSAQQLLSEEMRSQLHEA